MGGLSALGFPLCFLAYVECMDKSRGCGGRGLLPVST